jgi:uncharacterized protein YbjT (DUF2867 family)
MAAGIKVAVTGAGGRTGKLVVKRLLEAQDADANSVSQVAATVRSGDSLLRLKSDLPELAAAHNNVYVVDIAKIGREVANGATAVNDPDLSAALEGADALIIVTSGVPQIMKRSLVWVMLSRLIGKQGVRPSFRWKQGEEPKLVDWYGQKAQIDAAIAAGVKRVVIVSSAGGTSPDNPLNALGNGNILQFKRRAEQYLFSKVSEGRIEGVVLHPGGLVDTPALQRPLVFGVDDALLKRAKRAIPRDDVARVCVAAVLGPGAAAFKNKSLDLICDAPADGAEEDDAAKAKAKADAKAQDLAALVTALGATCDYTINDCSAFE